MSREWFLAGGAIACFAAAVITGAAAQTESVPDFSSNGTGWQTANGGEFVAVPGSLSGEEEELIRKLAALQDHKVSDKGFWRDILGRLTS